MTGHAAGSPPPEVTGPSLDPDPARVAEAAGIHVGGGPWTARRVPGFAGNAVFALEDGRDRLVLKMSQANGLTAEAKVCELVRALGVPAPEVVHLELDDARLGRPYLLMAHVGGDEAGPAHPALPEVGAHLRRIHEVELPDFGWLGADPSRLGGSGKTWMTVTWAVPGLEKVESAGLIPPGQRAAVESAIERHRDVLENLEVGRLLHGDLHRRHIYVDGDALSGIIDWGDSLVGDPLYDLGRLHRADPDSLARILEGYGPLAWEGAELARRLNLYAVLFIATATVWEFEAGAPWASWFDHQTEDLLRHLAEL